MTLTVPITYQRDPATGQILFDANGYPIYGSNAGANTYGAMQSRVQEEVLGSPDASDIQNAIGDAIATFERQSFWFNNIRVFGDVTGSASDLQTNNGQEFYSNIDLPVLVNFPHISKILVFAFNNRYPLISRTNQWIDDQSLSVSWMGLPTDWAWTSGSLRLYPIPNGGYPLILDATIRFAPLVNDADYSVWTNEAEALIRTEAKRLLMINITRNLPYAQALAQEIYGNPEIGMQGYLSQLRRENMSRAAGPVKIRASRGYM